jgi:hypothetical protein
VRRRAGWIAAVAFVAAVAWAVWEYEYARFVSVTCVSAENTASGCWTTGSGVDWSAGMTLSLTAAAITGLLCGVLAYRRVRWWQGRTSAG